MSDKDYRVSYDNYMNTNAATEVTGLIPSGEYSRKEWDAYRDIFNFEPIPHRETRDDIYPGAPITYSDPGIDAAAPHKKRKKI